MPSQFLSKLRLDITLLILESIQGTELYPLLGPYQNVNVFLTKNNFHQFLRYIPQGMECRFLI